MTKEELLSWGDETIKLYNGIAEELGRENVPAFYMQSDLNNIVGMDSVDVIIAGINPGSGGTYQQMIDNPNWDIDSISGMTAEQLISGNFGKDPHHGNCTNWSLHNTWNYFRNLRTYFSGLGQPNILDDESKFVMTNATFFNTAKKSELNQTLLNQTFPQTLRLIKEVKPKMIVFLSGEDAFNRLASLDIDDFSFKYDRKLNPIFGRIYIGEFNNIPCYGVPHPAYKTNEEKLLVAKFFSYVHNYCTIDDINIEELKESCSNEIQSYQNRTRGKKAKKNKYDFNRIEHAVLTNMESYIYHNENRIRKDENAQYGITIAKRSLYIDDSAVSVPIVALQSVPSYHCKRYRLYRCKRYQVF